MSNEVNAGPRFAGRSSLAAVWPPFALRVTAGDLELHQVTDDDIPQLVDLIRQGIHDVDRMPFFMPWTDASPETIGANTAGYYWQMRAAFSPQTWTLDLAVRVAGELVGIQGISTRDYLVTRTGETGSWLVRSRQGQGIGTRMRQAMCALLFDHLGAEEVTSGAFTDNPASLAVSRKVGYTENGTTRLQRRPGELAVNQRLVLTPDRFVRGEPIDVTGLAEFRQFIGLDA